MFGQYPHERLNLPDCMHVTNGDGSVEHENGER